MLTRPKKRYVPDLAFYLSLCEWSYDYLLQLYPRDCYTIRTFHSQHQHYLKIQLEESCRYTRTLTLTYHFSQIAMLLPCVMQVRIYDDAKLVEVLAYQKHTRLQPRYAYPNVYMYGVDEKHQLNNLLHEWLYYWIHNQQICENSRNL